ncbi:MAG: hypothetical protein QM811_25510 [Pirellulales bacterium]
MHLDFFQDLVLHLEGEVPRADLADDVRRVEAEIAGDWTEVWGKRLERIGPRIDLRLDFVRRSITEIADLLQPGTAAIFLDRTASEPHWVMLTEAGGGAVKVHDPRTPDAPRWLGESEFAKSIDAASKATPVDCVIAQPALRVARPPPTTRTAITGMPTAAMDTAITACRRSNACWPSSNPIAPTSGRSSGTRSASAC